MRSNGIRKILLPISGAAIATGYAVLCLAQPTGNQVKPTQANPLANQRTLSSPAPLPGPVNSPVELREEKEEKIPPHSFAIAFYKPTYLLPYYYTATPYNQVYADNTPTGERLNNDEIKYQISFKVPVWQNIFNYPTTLYLAYTQLSYWQAYNNTAFFRESDYEPEIFLANEINFHLIKDWYINFLTLGAVHQSNGFGGLLERSWNRVYVEAVSSTDHWMVSVRPWYIIHDKTMREHNPNIADFLGYGQILIAYKYYSQVFSIQVRNLVEGGGRRATAEFTWSFPLTSYLNGYVQLFSGYGQSLIEYDHRTNSAGIGLALSNWI
jgi:phospholipase A1